jgi:hypothetical protein
MYMYFGKACDIYVCTYWNDAWFSWMFHVWVNHNLSYHIMTLSNIVDHFHLGRFHRLISLYVCVDIFHVNWFDRTWLVLWHVVENILLMTSAIRNRCEIEWRLCAPLMTETKHNRYYSGWLSNISVNIAWISVVCERLTTKSHFMCLKLVRVDDYFNAMFHFHSYKTSKQCNI